MPGPTHCTYGNVLLSQGFDFTFGPGVTPSVCSLNTIPHVSSLPQVATLTLETIGGATLVFPDCALEEPRLSVGGSGQRWILPVKDRRWKWQEGWGVVYGHYNVPKPDQTYTQEKTPRELATLLFQEMGESGFDVSKLPNDPRPEIHWDGAHAATELDQLCASIGCVVVLNPFTNNAEIWKVGQGATLPTGGTQGAAYTPILPIKPSKIIVEAGPTLFQATFKTEAVGLDIDEKWKPIDELSYKPASGWGKSAMVAGFPEITGTFNKGTRALPIRELAKATVFRCYRISGLAHGGWRPEEMQKSSRYPNGRKDLKFYSSQAEDEPSPADSGQRALPARVYGRWYTIENSFVESLVDGYLRGEDLKDYTEGYQFDTEQAIITFGEPLVLFKDGDAIPAVIRIETSFNAGYQGVLDRWEKEYDLNPGWSTPARVIQRHDIYTRVYMRYTKDDAYTVESNKTDTERRLAHWGDAAVGEYEQQNGGTVKYAQLMQISPDGLTQQITWSGGGGRAPSTTVSQAQRHNRFVPPLKEQRAQLAAKKSEKAIAQLAVIPELKKTLMGIFG